jgi:hypothetical protein
VVLVPNGPLRNACAVLQRLGPLSGDVALMGAGGLREWLARPGLGHEEVCRVVHALKWPGEEGIGPCDELTVKGVTAMLMAPVVRQREAAHRAYTAQAFAGSPAPPDAAQQEARAISFMKSLKTVWRLQWANAYKEPLWRLAVNGVRGAGGHGIVMRAPCVCGYAVPRAHTDGSIHRQHAFWECPVAAAVREELQRGLGPRVQLQQWNVWLLQPPWGSAVRPVVWRVVATAATYAMDRGRAVMWAALRKGGQPAAAAQTAGSQRAAGEFWMALEAFARDFSIDDAPGWGAVGPDHPFLCVTAADRLAVRLPG